MSRHSSKGILSAHLPGCGHSDSQEEVHHMGGHLALKRAPKSAILITVVALLLSPVASFGQATTPGGTFTGAWVGPCCVGIANSNPLIAGGDQHFLSKIYEPLVTYSIDTTTGGYGPTVPALATDWTTSTDRLP